MKNKKTYRPAPLPPVAETPPTPVQRHTYIGTPYERGIRLPSGRLIRPLSMSDTDIDNLIAAEPFAASLFETTA